MLVKSEDPNTNNLLVFLDGKLLGFVLEANDEEGYVDVLDYKSWKCARDRGGPSIDVKFFTERLYGKVEIREKEVACQKE